MYTTIVEVTVKPEGMKVTGVFGCQPMTGILGNKPAYSPSIGDSFEDVMIEMADHNWVIEATVNVEEDKILYHFYLWSNNSHFRLS